MLFHKPILTLLLILIGVLQIHSTNSGVLKSSAHNLDFIIGELTANSVLAHTERVTAYNNATLDWHGLYNITRIEALDQTEGSTGCVFEITGGINSLYARVGLNAYYQNDIEIDFIINIYGELLEKLPSNDFIIGEETLKSRLVHTKQISSTNGFAYFDFNSRLNIVNVEALEQTFGGYVNSIFGGVNSTFVTLYFQEIFNGGSQSAERVHGDSWYSKYFSWRNTAFIVKRLEVLDQNNGFGSESTLMDGGVDHRFVTLDCYTWSLEPLDYDFIIYIYGEPFSTNDVIQGEITDTSSLVHSVRISEEYGYFPFFQWSSAALISRIEIIDLSFGTGGFVSYVRGGVGEREVYVLFDFMHEYGWTDFQVNVYVEPITPNDFTVGELTSNSWLVHRERIYTFGFYNFYWSGPFLITRFEAHDQSYGYGGFVSGVHNGTTSVQISFRSVTQNSNIEFFIDLYGEPIY